MHNSELKAVVRYDNRICDVIRNQPNRAVSLLLEDYRLSNDKTGFVAALIGALAVEKSRNRFKGAA